MSLQTELQHIQIIWRAAAAIGDILKWGTKSDIWLACSSVTLQEDHPAFLFGILDVSLP